MPFTEQGLPFSGKVALSRHHSYKAAEAAQQARGRKTREYLAFLREVGHLTDLGAAECLGLPLQSICSIRNALLDAGLVQAIGSQVGRYGRTVTVWGAKEG